MTTRESRQSNQRKKHIIGTGLILGHLLGMSLLIYLLPIQGDIRGLLWLGTGAAMWWAAIETTLHWCPNPAAHELSTEYKPG